MRKNINQEGYSVIEIIIAVTVMTVLTLVVSTFLVNATLNWNRNESQVTLQATNQVAMDSMAASLRQAVAVIPTNTISDSQTWTTGTSTIVLQVPVTNSSNATLFTDTARLIPCKNEMIIYQSGGDLNRRILANTTAGCNAAAGNTATTGTVSLIDDTANANDTELTSLTFTMGNPVGVSLSTRITKYGKQYDLTSDGRFAYVTGGNSISFLDDDVGPDRTAIAVPADGLPVVAYFHDSSSKLRVAKCANIACTSTSDINFYDNPSTSNPNPSIAIGADGYPVISGNAQGINDLFFIKCTNYSCNNDSVTVVDDTTSSGLHSSIAVPADGLPVISYYDSTNTALKVLKCGNAACSSGNSLNTPDNTASVGTYTSIAIGSDGFPVVSYYDASSTRLKVLKCGNAACSSGNTITTVGSGFLDGEYSSIAVPADGLPVISYVHDLDVGLKVLKCGNAACSSGNTTTSVGAMTYSSLAGEYTSLILASGDGLPVISYYDIGLKVLKCGNAACSSGNTVVTVDTGSDLGLYSSMALGIDGLPIISYFSGSDEVKVAKCGRITCD